MAVSTLQTLSSSNFRIEVLRLEAGIACFEPEDIYYIGLGIRRIDL